MSKARIIVLLAAAAALQGCATNGTSTRTTLLPETLAKPAASRAIEGSLLAPLEGGLISQATDTGMSEKDRVAALQAEYRALEHSAIGQPVNWSSSSGRASGQVVSGQPYRVGSQDCRQYSQTVTAGGRMQELKGSACRNTDGSWSRLT